MSGVGLDHGIKTDFSIFFYLISKLKVSLVYWNAHRTEIK